MKSPFVRTWLCIIALLATSGCRVGSTPIPKSLEEMKCAIVGGEWRSPGGGFGMSLLSDGILRARTVESYGYFPEPCPIPTELLANPRWTISNYTSDPTGRTTCALTVESDGTAPSEYRLRWHSGEGDYSKDDYDHLELKHGVCRWELERMK